MRSGILAGCIPHISSHRIALSALALGACPRSAVVEQPISTARARFLSLLRYVQSLAVASHIVVRRHSNSNHLTGIDILGVARPKQLRRWARYAPLFHSPENKRPNLLVRDLSHPAKKRHHGQPLHEDGKGNYRKADRNSFFALRDFRGQSRARASATAPRNPPQNRTC
jgi:hypothetical protein